METERHKYKRVGETERLKDKGEGRTERQRQTERATENDRDRETGRVGNGKTWRWTQRAMWM